MNQRLPCASGSPAAPRGFTLLEVILAMSLSAALIAGLWTVISVHLKSYDVGRTGVETAQLVRSMSQQVEIDLRSLAEPQRFAPQFDLAAVSAAVSGVTTAETDAGPKGEPGAAQPSVSNPPTSAPSAASAPSTSAPFPARPSIPTAPLAPTAPQPPGTPRAPRLIPSGNSSGPSAPAPASRGSTPATRPDAALNQPPPPPEPVQVAAPTSDAAAIQLNGQRHSLEMTLPVSPPRSGWEPIDERRRGDLAGRRVVRYYVALPEDAWLEVFTAGADAAPPLGMLVRREERHLPVPSEWGGAAASADQPAAVTGLRPADDPASGVSLLSMLEVREIPTFAFRYFDGQGWQDHWHSGERNGLPRAIEVRWAIPRPRRFMSPVEQAAAEASGGASDEDPFAPYTMSGPNAAPEMIAQMQAASAWQVERAVVALVAGSAGLAPLTSSAPAAPTAAGESSASSAPPLASPGGTP